MKVTITQAVIDRAKPKLKPYEIRDRKLVGFLIRVQPTGKMTYYCEYRRGGRIKIGPESAYSVKLARILAQQILARYYQGGEPILDVKKDKEITTYRKFLEEHYFEWVEANHNASAATKRCLLVDCAPFLKMRMEDITPQTVEKWRIAKVVSGLSPHTANRSYATLRASLTKAEEWDFIPEHPLRKMKPMKTNSNLKIRFLSGPEEIRLRSALDKRENHLRNQRRNGNQWRNARSKTLLRDLDTNVFVDHLKPMVLVAMNTGIRRGELFSLKWHNIDFERRQLTIEGTNAKSRKTRHIPLNNEAYSVLSSWKKQIRKEGSYVFLSYTGGPFKDVKTAWKRLLLDAEIHDFRWHDIRHHFASKLVIKGAPLNTVRELLGHSSHTMTIRYAHLSARHKADAVSLLLE